MARLIDTTSTCTIHELTALPLQRSKNKKETFILIILLLEEEASGAKGGGVDRYNKENACVVAAGNFLPTWADDVNLSIVCFSLLLSYRAGRNNSETNEAL